MRYLLDTHALVWFLQDAPELPDAVARRIEADDAENHVSIASVWEMAIKISLDKLRVPYDLATTLPELLAEGGFRVLPLEFRHLETVRALPFHHRDPFDRLLVAQTTMEDLTLLSRDSVFDTYGVRRLWI